MSKNTPSAVLVLRKGLPTIWHLRQNPRKHTLTGLRGTLKSRRQPWSYREAIEILV